MGSTKIGFWDLMRRPYKMPWMTKEEFEKALRQWNKEVGIETEPGVQINLTKNIFIFRKKDTGEIIKKAMTPKELVSLNPEEYELIDDEQERLE